MTENEIVAILNRELRSSSGYIGGEIVSRRRKSLEYYLGKPFGNEQEGRSQVVSTDVSDTIESLMPSLMKIFTAGDNVFHCEPAGPEDEKVAKQASDYINHVFYKENRGFSALYTAFKDALVQKNGILKVYWDDSEKTTREEYKKLTDDEYNLLLADDEVTESEHQEYDEEFKDNNDKSIESANFVCHRVSMTRTLLVEMGYDKDMVYDLPTGNSEDYLEDRQVRYQDTDFSSPQDRGDSSSDEILVHECYVRLDVNGDGKSELMKVCLAGNGSYKILDMTEVDSIPFVSMTPIIMPHRFYGRSVSELIEDIQLIKSTVMRQMLDNMYLTNNNRIAIQDGQVAMDDLLTNRPGGIVRTKQPPANVMQVMAAQPITEQASGLLNYLDSVREARSGVTKSSQGLQTDSLNTDTATGMNQVLTQSQMRMELIARTFAETGVKDLGIKIFELLCKYQQKEKLVRIRGEFVPMAPYEWRNRVNLSVKVGLGTGSKEQQLILLNGILQRQLQAIQLQQNVYGPVVNLKNIYSTLQKLVENAGLGSVEPFFMDPEVGASQMPPLPPKPPT